jgi:hypothetical protein
MSRMHGWQTAWMNIYAWTFPVQFTARALVDLNSCVECSEECILAWWWLWRLLLISYQLTELKKALPIVIVIWSDRPWGLHTTMRSWYVLRWLAQANKPHIVSWTWRRLRDTADSSHFSGPLMAAALSPTSQLQDVTFVCSVQGQPGRHAGILFFTDHDFDSQLWTSKACTISVENTLLSCVLFFGICRASPKDHMFWKLGFRTILHWSLRKISIHRSLSFVTCSHIGSLISLSFSSYSYILLQFTDDV